MTQRIIDPLAVDATSVTEWPDGGVHQCRITGSGVFIDGVPVPNYIDVDGVEVIPGEKGKELNRVRVTLLVSDIVIEDDAAEKVKFPSVRA